MTYDELLIEAAKDGLKIKEKPLSFGLKGLYKNGKIIIDKNLNTNTERRCILAEEIGHHHKTYGNIIDENDISNKKQERIARIWAYKKLVGLTDIIRAHKYGVKSRFEFAEYLNVTESFLDEALSYYKDKYGLWYELDNYIIRFDPLGVLEKFQDF
ncbi:hypothetical protein BH721_01510 [Clostridium baratii]|uniref:ImmA/IrrE family metallo-endopeptidase n=1 Tax=Clostridium baratii TaxID=1561 RepID=UPI0009A3CEB4|nr:ImmA/IrrE family metallo-endopeptidase [Clostridium baratii]OPF51519.1 hypothetical protein A1M12_02965 [Clostridium baratii]OPF55411.1 hypothetical protein BH721_01510 [Clostridium baratii]OPF57694.1 hypothetical protein BH724_08765 [Clostridium baratii]OPF60208.1 hypothetical protein BH725_06415 [Clostridium baratii]